MEKCGKNLVTQTLTLTFTAPKYFNKNSYFIAIKHEKTNVADIQIRIILFFFFKIFFFFNFFFFFFFFFFFSEI